MFSVSHSLTVVVSPPPFARRDAENNFYGSIMTCAESCLVLLVLVKRKLKVPQDCLPEALATDSFQPKPP